MLPFEGLRVIECGSNVAGPVVGTIFGDLGAEVIKIEKPDGGDDARTFAPPYLEDLAASFQAINRNKSSVVLDFKNDDDVEALRELVRGADVFLHNMRPGVADKLGVSGPEALKLNPRLIYGEISGYGSTGPWRERSAYDQHAQAVSSWMVANGEPSDPLTLSALGPVDKATGVWLAMLISSALFRRERTGEGGIVETSLLEAALFIRDMGFAQYQASGQVPVRTGNRAPTTVPMNLYEASDGPLFIACAGEGLFAKLARLLDRTDWLKDDRFKNKSARRANREEFERQLGEILQGKTRAEWVELIGPEVPCAPVLDVDEATSHPQIRGLDVFQPYHETKELLGPTFRIDGRRPPIRRWAPTLGEDTERVLTEIRKRSGAV